MSAFTYYKTMQEHGNYIVLKVRMYNSISYIIKPGTRKSFDIIYCVTENERALRMAFAHSSFFY